MTAHEFLWCDVETTGLPKDGPQLLLEIAVVLAEDGPGGSCAPVDCFTAVVACVVKAKPGVETLDVSYNIDGPFVTVSPYVVSTHAKNNLMRECQGPLAKPIGAVDAELHDWLVERGCERNGVLAGNSVHFDLGFVRDHLPRTFALLSHRVADVTAMRLGWEAASGVQIVTAMPAEHRAVADIVASLETYAELRARWAEGFGK